jgi:hypothetical protein
MLILSDEMADVFTVVAEMPTINLTLHPVFLLFR